MTRRGDIAAFLAFITVVVWCGCSRLPTQMAGGSGSETVIGKALMPNGSPAAKAAVRLRSASYLSPLSSASAHSAAANADAVTDDSGRFSVSAIDTGRYCLEINTNTGHAKLLRFTVDGVSRTSDIGIATLEKAATAQGIARDVSGGAARIYGLERIVSIDSMSGAFSFSDLPAGDYTFRFVPKIKQQTAWTVSSVKISAGDVQDVSLLSGWTSSKRLYFNTTASGANISGSVVDFPTLIRLTKDNFDFAGAQGGGADLRFAKSDNTPLSYEIERWDPAAGAAEAWVKVDTVFGGDSSRFITMYWGNPNVSSRSSGSAVFDTGAPGGGFQGVWHLQETDKGKAADATGNHYDGIPSDTAPSPVMGCVGVAQQFNGVSNFITLQGTAGGKLNFSENGTFTVSAWVKVDRLNNNQSSVIVSKQLYQYSLQLRNDNYWEFHNYADTIGFESTASSASASAGVWAHVVGVRSGRNQYFYVNGTLNTTFTEDAVAAGNATMPRITSDNVSIGRLPAINNSGQTWRHFTGAIDEVRISNIAQTADWIKLCYMNQRSDDRLISY
jgi:hypothetical protein